MRLISSCALVIALLSATVAWAGPNCSPIYPLKKDSPLQKKFISWLARSERAQKLARPASRNLYEVDINNDGKKELVIASQEGSLKLTSFDIYEQDPEFKFLFKDAIPKPNDIEHDGFWHSHAYTGKKPSELFIQCDGEVALSFQGTFPGARELYVWKGEQTTRACSGPWFQFYLNEAKQFVVQKNLFFAENDLGWFYQHCESQLGLPEKTTLLRELVNIEVAIGDSKTCIHYSDLLRRSEVTDATTDALCKNIDPHVNLKVFENARSPFYSLDQLVEVSVPLTHDVNFKRVDEDWIQVKMIPGIHGKRTISFDIRKYVRDSFRHKFDKTMLTPRIALFEGCRTETCEERAMLWVDSEKHTSAFAISRYDRTPLHRNKNCVLLGSRLFNPATVPDAFWKRYKEFRKKYGLSEKLPACMIYEHEGQYIFTVLERPALRTLPSPTASPTPTVSPSPSPSVR